MLRGRVQGVDHCCFHITHRCQERRFLLKFEIDRRNYTKRLREASQKYRVAILTYMVTSNHVHLLVWTDDADRVSAMMQYVQGTTGRDFNRRKDREGAYWRDRYHPTLIQSGEHLSRCLFYIDLNMVRCRAVAHPSEWRCSGFHELIGSRQRYRLIDQSRLLLCLGQPCAESEFEQWYSTTLEEKLVSGYLMREAMWSECVAVGDRDWILDLAESVKGIRHEVVRYEHPNELGEASVSYGLKVSRRVQRSLAPELAKRKRLGADFSY